MSAVTYHCCPEFSTAPGRCFQGAESRALAIAYATQAHARYNVNFRVYEARNGIPRCIHDTREPERFRQAA